MKVFVAFAAICAIAAALPASLDKDAVATREEFDNIGVDGYSFAYETSNGISREESARVNDLGSDAEEIVINGRYSYVADDGQTYTITFLADRNGFQPQGAHIPQ